MPYEAANALVRATVTGGLELQEGAEVIAIARRLGRQSAYDAAYVALAQSLDAELWTLDRPLARNARGIGLPVRLLG